MAGVWMVRAGKEGEAELSNFEKGVSSVGHNYLPDLSKIKSREDIYSLHKEVDPEVNETRMRILGSQMWAFISFIQRGDFVLLPRKTKPGTVAIGRITGEYEYWAKHNILRHVRKTDWLTLDFPRDQLDPDLKRAVGVFATVYELMVTDAHMRVSNLVGKLR